MISYPNAKINLGLNIIRKRTDGFHDIESVFYPVPWYDMLEIVPEKSGRGKVNFTSSGIDIPSSGNLNLCEQVYVLMHREFNLPSVRIHLHKIIPIGAGLGGGSADAAFTAVMLNDMFQLDLSTEKLEEIVVNVGSDCPFFISNQAAFVTGRGEVLSSMELDLSGYWMALINPGIHIGTAEAYSGIIPSVPKTGIKELIQLDVADWPNKLSNDFELSVFDAYPQIKELKDKLYSNGALYASMTGSGSTVFGIFENKPDVGLLASGYAIKIMHL